MADTFDRFSTPHRGRFGDNEAAAHRPRVTGRSDLHDITVALHAETAKAVLVSEFGDEKKAKWIPKSQIEIERTDRFIQPQGVGSKKFAAIVIAIPEWLATRNELL